MDLSRQYGATYVQCQHCGEVYKIPQKLSAETLMVKAECPTCNGTIALNCGEKYDDIYLYCNPNLDYRYYQY